MRSSARISKNKNSQKVGLKYQKVSKELSNIWATFVKKCVAKIAQSLKSKEKKNQF